MKYNEFLKIIESDDQSNDKSFDLESFKKEINDSKDKRYKRI